MASSNFLVDKIKPIVAFRMNELVLISRDVFPYRSVCVKEYSNYLRVGIFQLFTINISNSAQVGESIIVVNRTAE